MSTNLSFTCWTRPDGYLQGILRRALVELMTAMRVQRSGGEALDMGCGDRRYEADVRALGFTYIGADLGDGQDLKIEDGKPLTRAAASCDLVLSTQVLEHVWDVAWYLGECRRVLRPDGALVLSTHGVWPYHPHPTDFHRWTCDGLVREVEANGFRVERLVPVLGPLAWTTQFRVLGVYKVIKLVSPTIAALAAPFYALANLVMRCEDALTPSRMIASDASVYVLLARPKV